MPKAHFLFVPDVFHVPAHYEFLRRLLESVDYLVTIDAVAIGMAIEIAARQPYNIIAVFHGYAACPGSTAVAKLSEFAAGKVQNLIFLATCAPIYRRIMFPVCYPRLASWVGIQAQSRNQARYVLNPAETFFPDATPEQAQRATQLMSTHSGSIFSNQALVDEGWKLFPSAFILCVRDKINDMGRVFGTLCMMSNEERENLAIYLFSSAHDPNVTHPHDLVRLLRKIAGELLPYTRNPTELDIQVDLIHNLV